MIDTKDDAFDLDIRISVPQDASKLPEDCGSTTCATCLVTCDLSCPWSCLCQTQTCANTCEALTGRPCRCF